MFRFKKALRNQKIKTLKWVLLEIAINSGSSRPKSDVIKEIRRRITLLEDGKKDLYQGVEDNQTRIN